MTGAGHRRETRKTMLGVVVAVALMPMPRSVEMRGGTVAATGEVRIVESRDAAIAAGVNCAPVE